MASYRPSGWKRTRLDGWVVDSTGAMYDVTREASSRQATNLKTLIQQLVFAEKQSCVFFYERLSSRDFEGSLLPKPRSVFARGDFALACLAMAYRSFYPEREGRKRPPTYPTVRTSEADHYVVSLAFDTDLHVREAYPLGAHHTHSETEAGKYFLKTTTGYSRALIESLFSIGGEDPVLEVVSIATGDGDAPCRNLPEQIYRLWASRSF